MNKESQIVVKLAEFKIILTKFKLILIELILSSILISLYYSGVTYANPGNKIEKIKYGIFVTASLFFYFLHSIILKDKIFKSIIIISSLCCLPLIFTL